MKALIAKENPDPEAPASARLELVDKERQEIEIIRRFLPKQMNEAEMADAIGTVIEELGADSIKDMGRTMGVLKERCAGRMDFAKAALMVKERLGA